MFIPLNAYETKNLIIDFSRLLDHCSGGSGKV